MDFSKIIEDARCSDKPVIYFVKQAGAAGKRLGIFGSSFNPVTIAHTELMRLAATQFHLDTTLALAGIANADKTGYECTLEDRLQMLALALSDSEQYAIGLSSHPYFVDQLDALETIYRQEVERYFIVGIDTFERLLDRDDKYTKFYHRRFTDRVESLEYLLNRSHLIVAGRAGTGLGEIQSLTEWLPDPVRHRVLYLDFPADLAEHSATLVRKQAHDGASLAGMVHPAVEQFINERGLYR